jgi:hypothetical protein
LTPLPVPGRPVARRLVVAIGVFWAAWGCAVFNAETSRFAAVIGVSVVLGLAAVTYFYATLFHAYSLSMYTWSFRDQGARWRVMLNLLNPRWLWQTLRSTEWPALIVAVGLLLILAADLVLFAILMSLPTRR